MKYPEAIKSLPPETIFVDWNYGWNMNNFGDHRKLVESGFDIWGAPALRSNPDNYYLTQWEKHFDNIRNFVPAARGMGYKGIVLTSWSTSGAYSYEYESENSLAGLYAIRHVYPITGFNILLAAYMESLRSVKPLDVPAFITGYGMTEYGFTPSQARAFREALLAAPYEVADGTVESPRPLSVSALADSCTDAAKALHALHPLKNGREFEQYRLMADIRARYVRFLVLEQRVNGPHFIRDDIPSVLQKLRSLLAMGPGLSQKFMVLNGSSYYLSELKEENQLRNAGIQALYDRLDRIR